MSSLVQDVLHLGRALATDERAGADAESAPQGRAIRVHVIPGMYSSSPRKKPSMRWSGGAVLKKAGSVSRA